MVVLVENSALLVLGAVAGLVWANLWPTSYAALLHFPLLENDWIGYAEHGTRVINAHFLVNDILMALFFAIAGKEVWESLLPGGPLQEPRRAANPLAATVGGMMGPACIYLLGAVLLGRTADLAHGWAIPCATDIAFSYLVARLVFGPNHPAIPFLLLLAIADDALGLIVLAVFYPVGPVEPLALLLCVAGVLGGLALRRMHVTSFWPYLFGAGAVSWLGFALAGLHPALGLLPIIPTLPHAHTSLGAYMTQELARSDTLTEFEQWWNIPVEVILGLFGMLNAGVALGALGAPTALVFGGLLLGKPIGIFGGGWLALRLGFGLPVGMTTRDLFVVGLTASIGFTVALFVSVVAFPAGAIQDAAKMGALASIAAVIPAFVFGRLLGVGRAAKV
jgi:NhaA family Na+:H+ antiporter